MSDKCRILQLLTLIQENLTCFICKEKIKDAVLLKCCNQFVCKCCLDKWHAYSCNKKCPFCREDCLYSTNVSEFFSNVSELVGYLKQDEDDTEDFCQEHSMFYNYYCCQCKVKICSDCLFDNLSTGSHTDHQIVKLDQLYRQKLKKTLEKLYDKIDFLKDGSLDLLASYKSITDKKKLFLQKTKEELKNISDDLNIPVFESMESLDEIEHLINYIDEILLFFYSRLHSRDDEELNGSISQINGSINEINYVFHNNFYSLPKVSIKNPLVPKPSRFVIKIPNFRSLVEEHRKKNMPEHIYTDKICLNGNVWRGKIYPNGYSNGLNTHLSFFFELLDGPIYYTTYIYSLEIKHNIYELNAEPIVRIASSQFIIGDKWGWDRAASLAEIMSPKYIESDGCLKLYLSIRSDFSYQDFIDTERKINYYESQIQAIESLVET